MKTDTPRTDALVGGRDEIDRCLPTVALLARQLERELTAARAEVEDIRGMYYGLLEDHKAVTEQRDRLAKALKNIASKISSLYPASQVLAEIAWIDREIERVTELMKRRPSKIRHLRDLERQKRDRQQILEANPTK
jgi:chromosome segregation ATPase